MLLEITTDEMIRMMKDRIDNCDDMDELCRYAEGILGFDSGHISPTDIETCILHTGKELGEGNISLEDVKQYDITVKEEE